MDVLVVEEEVEVKGNEVRLVVGFVEFVVGVGLVVIFLEYFFMDFGGIDFLDLEFDILLGILDNLDLVMFFKCFFLEFVSLEEFLEVYLEGFSFLLVFFFLLVGMLLVKLEVINELICFDYIYIKFLVLEIFFEIES